MNKIICIILATLFLSGCFLRVHKMDIEQGNIITERDVARLHTGMSVQQVKAVMGNPLLINLFSPSHMSYVYTFQTGYQKMHVKRVDCIFNNNILREINETQT
ncbi:MAG: outer membrane protein assembly factor BamE [Gammaproteobacteria bacterium]|nr:outer membrane protein assembly factor BamE [Gammaproteobacteria bacterium]